MRLIDADKLEPKFIHGRWEETYVSETELRNAPTVDAVEVTRCKNCRWGREACGNIECFVDSNVPPEYHGYNWFCPNGEGKSK